MFTPVIPFCKKDVHNASNVHHQFVTPPYALTCMWPASLQIHVNKRKRLHKERPGRKEFHPIIGFEHQNDRRLVLFWNTNMTVVTSYEDTLYRQTPSREKLRDKLSFQTKDLRSVLNSS